MWVMVTALIWNLDKFDAVLYLPSSASPSHLLLFAIHSHPRHWLKKINGQQQFALSMHK